MSLSDTQRKKLKKVADGNAGNLKSGKLVRLFENAGAKIQETRVGFHVEFGKQKALIFDEKKSRGSGGMTMTDNVQSMAQILLNKLEA